MTEPKTSRLKSFWAAISPSGPQKPEYTEIPLAGDAIRVVADQKLRERLAEWKTAVDLINTEIEATSLYGYLTELLDILETLNTIILRVAFVYARAGDKEASEAKQLTHGWNRLYGIYHAFIMRARIWWGTNESITDARDNRQSIHAVSVEKAYMACENVLFPHANHVIAWCFKDIDVRPGVVTVVQTMMPMGMGGGGETLTSSGGRTSEDQMRHPQGGPYPRRVNNEVK